MAGQGGDGVSFSFCRMGACTPLFRERRWHRSAVMRGIHRHRKKVSRGYYRAWDCCLGFGDLRYVQREKFSSMNEARDRMLVYFEGCLAACFVWSRFSLPLFFLSPSVLIVVVHRRNNNRRYLVCTERGGGREGGKKKRVFRRDRFGRLGPTKGVNLGVVVCARVPTNNFTFAQVHSSSSTVFQVPGRARGSCTGACLVVRPFLQLHRKYVVGH